VSVFCLYLGVLLYIGIWNIYITIYPRCLKLVYIYPCEGEQFFGFFSKWVYNPEIGRVKNPLVTCKYPFKTNDKIQV